MFNGIREIALSGLFAALASASHGAVIAYTWEEGGNLVTEYSGSLDLSGLTFAQGLTNVNYRRFQPNRNFYWNMDDYQGHFDASISVTGGASSTVLANPSPSVIGHTTYYGSVFGYGNTSGLSRGGAVYTAFGYSNNDAISGGSTTLGASLSTLGLSGPATVSYSWSTDSITHFYGVAAPSPVPLPASLPLVVTGLGALFWMRRRKKA
ncbi:arginyl-tRNA-protein transferase [Roseobacter sp. SK209-2-6]|uniref:VPLPA-CTERM sorting domain-containing protein n=1 Tax=Roseobacter sp. SK209-2-6 TaxID=388739 RepID=UPI0000F3F48A|nr:VPLPA-CTERM sorting domain-containing protein [Roseobacter sp. SK209-2-6]EBA16426.1 arginyl-tRNA-protein transferase [Roseobacter sp. SK209-2-6]